MGKTRVYEVAQDIGLGKEELVEKINAMDLGFVVSNYMSALTDEQATSVRKAIERERRRQVVEERIRPTVIRRRPSRKRRGESEEPEAVVEASSAEPAAEETPVEEPSEAPAGGVLIRRRRKRVVTSAAEELPVSAPKREDDGETESVAEPAAVSEPESAPALAAASEPKVEPGVAEPPLEPVAVTPAGARTDSDTAQAEAVEAARAARRERPAPAVAAAPKPSNIVGAIDPEVIRARLAVDRKSFAPGPARDRRPERPRSAGRKVVDSRSLYQGNRRRPSRKSRSKSRSGPVERTQITQAAEHKRILRIADAITIGDLAHEMGVKSNEVIKFLMGQGTMMTMNQVVDVEMAELIAEHFGFTVEDVSFREETYLASETDAEEDLELRPPVVTVMGHVDHGKTSLLDAIRSSEVTAGEAGGITQHIGASAVDTSQGPVIFLDTPGHEAFTALRARGAKVTDLVVLVVAADDGVMPQTVEAINHARAAEVPIIVAVNKIDKPGANAERVKQALTEYNLIPEEWGGSTIFVEVSALQGTNIEDLLEMIALQAEVLELRANPDKAARGVVLEAYKRSGRGVVATLIVQEGTLKHGDIVVSGPTYGRVRTMSTERAAKVEDAGPSTPVEITGLSGVPEAGEAFFVAMDEKVAKEFTENVAQKRRASVLAARKVDPWAALKDTKKLAIIVKGDVQGSVEALKQSLEKLSTEEVEVDVIHTGVGGITESDVQLAIASNALVIGFSVRPEARANEIAKREGVQFELHSVIYDVIDRVKISMVGLLDPVFEERPVGQAEVRDMFSVPKVGTVAGCYIVDGKIIRGGKCRLVRDGKVIYDSKIGSLRRFKDDVKEVKSGFECGLSVENYNDLKIGDIVECYEMVEVAATL